MKELSITASSGTVLDELVSNLSKSTCLTTLELKSENHHSVPVSGWTSFFCSVRTVALVELRLGNVIRNDSVMMALCKYLASNRQLRILKFTHYDSVTNITSEEWRTFASTLQSSEIKELAVRCVYDQLVPELASILKLKRLCLRIDRFDSLQLLANAYSQAVLHVRRSMNYFGWQPHFYDLVCNDTTIDLTYRSNHTIKSLKFGHWRSLVSVELYSILNVTFELSSRQKGCCA
jgi:hypothetical protein